MAFSTENLQVGDTVIVVGTGWSNLLSVGEITKKTPTGFVDVKYGNGASQRFKSDGNAYVARERFSTGSLCLEYYTEKRELQIKQRQRRAGILNFLNGREWEIYTNDELEQLYKFITEFRDIAKTLD